MTEEKNIIDGAPKTFISIFDDIEIPEVLICLIWEFLWVYNFNMFTKDNDLWSIPIDSYTTLMTWQHKPLIYKIYIHFYPQKWIKYQCFSNLYICIKIPNMENRKFKIKSIYIIDENICGEKQSIDAEFSSIFH